MSAANRVIALLCSVQNETSLEQLQVYIHGVRHIVHYVTDIYLWPKDQVAMCTFPFAFNWIRHQSCCLRDDRRHATALSCNAFYDFISRRALTSYAPLFVMRSICTKVVNFPWIVSQATVDGRSIFKDCCQLLWQDKQQNLTTVLSRYNANRSSLSLNHRNPSSGARHI